MSLCIVDPLEMALLTNDDFLDKSNFDNTLQIGNYLKGAPGLYVTRWIPKKKVFEELSPLTKKLLPSNIKALIFVLKPLPKNLKYTFMGSKAKISMVISVYLNENQKEHLLSVLCKHKGA